MKPIPDHAVNRLRIWRKSVSTRPFRPWRQRAALRSLPAAPRLVCLRVAPRAQGRGRLLPADVRQRADEAVNTGRLIADVLPDTTWAFLWSRTKPHPELLALLADPVWQPYVVFPACEKEPARLTSVVTPISGKKPLFILLDGTWPEARKMFNKSPYLDGFPVLSIKPDALSTYGMRVAHCDEHLCTAEVAACVLEVAGELAAGQALQLWFNLFSSRYMAGRVSRAPARMKLSCSRRWPTSRAMRRPARPMPPEQG